MTLDYTRHYQKWHTNSDEHYKDMLNYYKNFLKPYLPPNKDIKILEIGCGMGFCLLALHELGYKHIEGIDIDQGQIQFCKNKGLNVGLVQDSEEFLSNKESEYDLIFAFDVIEHIPCSAQLSFVRAVFNALKFHGKFICRVPNADSLLASHMRYIDWTHQDSFTEYGLDFLLYNSGFQNFFISSIDDEFNILTRNPFRKIYLTRLIRKILLTIFRTIYRLQLFAELGNDAWKIPISLNVLGVAKKE